MMVLVADRTEALELIRDGMLLIANLSRRRPLSDEMWVLTSPLTLKLSSSSVSCSESSTS